MVHTATGAVEAVEVVEAVGTRRPEKLYVVVVYRSTTAIKLQRLPVESGDRDEEDKIICL
jgi:hypothetical protein